jgi:hypothetical protein
VTPSRRVDEQRAVVARTMRKAYDTSAATKTHTAQIIAAPAESSGWM